MANEKAIKLYGDELIQSLEADIRRHEECIESRNERIDMGWTDEDDCFISQRVDERGIDVSRRKLALLKNGGKESFIVYTDLDGNICKDWKWCNTKFGSSLRIEMPNGDVVWTSAGTAKGLARKGLKKMWADHDAWFKFSSPYSGMLGVYSGDYVTFPSDWNYLTGEYSSSENYGYSNFREYVED